MTSTLKRKYHLLEKLGEGTYGTVYKAQDKETEEVVALKQIKLDNSDDGFPNTALREITLLRKLNHLNVIQ